MFTKTLSLANDTSGSICVDNNNRVAIQDEFGRATNREVMQVYHSLETERARQRFLWVAQAALSVEDAVQVWKDTVARDNFNRMVEKDEAERNELWERAAKANDEAMERLTGLNKMYADLTAAQAEVAELREQLAVERAETNRLRELAMQAEREKYNAISERDEIVNALQVIEKYRA